MLMVHSIHLPVLTALIKQWAQEELGKPTEIESSQLILGAKYYCNSFFIGSLILLWFKLE